MKKRYLMMTAGLMLSLGLMTGCSAKTTEAETVTETEASSAEESVTEEETEESTSEEDASEEGEETAMDSFRIWGEITAVEDGRITVENQSENGYQGEIVFNIDPENTLVLGAEDGFPVQLEDVELGSFEAYLGPVMTMSLPPQTTPEMVIVNIPEDVSAPQYVLAAGPVEETEDGLVLTVGEDTQYALAEELEILPYLTRNIVTVEDIEKDSRCLIWLNEDSEVEKLVLFANQPE